MERGRGLRVSGLGFRVSGLGLMGGLKGCGMLGFIGFNEERRGKGFEFRIRV